MATLALALYLVYLAVVLGLRVVVHLKRTGSSGVLGISGRAGSVEWIGGLLFILAFALAAPTAVPDEVAVPVAALDGPVAHAAGIVLYAGGFATTVLAQYAMGESWRIGVDESERTELVTSGPFALVRNPIFSGMVPTLLALALLVPTAVALAAPALLLVSLEIQTRLVEEPYLLRAHGERYAAYAARVGRFVPGIGRLDRPPKRTALPDDPGR